MPTDLDRVRLLDVDGQRSQLDVTGAIAGDVTTTLTIEGASTVEVPIADHSRRFLRDPSFGDRSLVRFEGAGRLAGVLFELVAVKKSGDVESLVFEDLIVATLRRQTRRLSIKGGTSTRAQIVRRLAAEPAGTMRVSVDPTGRGRVRNPILRGGKNGVANSWELLADPIAEPVQWRRFSTGLELVVGGDDWLLTRKRPTVLRENTDGVAAPIDFDLDVGKRASEASTQIDVDLLALLPGDPVVLEQMGPASGKWLVSEISQSVTRTRADLKLVRGRHALKEPKKDR